MESTTTWLPTGALLEGRWRIDGKLGQGGFATVYHGVHTKLERRVAIKVLDIQASSEEMRVFEERFLREAKLAAQLEHPNIVQVLDFGLTTRDGLTKPFLVMERLSGHDLEHELLTHGPLEAERARKLFLNALDALSLCHGRGIVHRDLKPSNLFLTQPGTAQERLVILDFGIARVFEDPDSKLTATSHFTGTPAYLAPEYIREQIVTPALDVYQMGLIIGEALSGTPVVEASTPLAFLMAHCNGQQKLPEHLQGTPLGDVLQRAVKVDPGARPATAGALQRELEQVDWSTSSARRVLIPTQPDAPLPPASIDPFDATAAELSLPDHLSMPELGPIDEGFVPGAIAPPLTPRPRQDTETGPHALPPPPEPATPASSSANKARLLAIIAAVAVLCIGAGAMGALMLTSAPPPTPAVAHTTPAQDEPAVDSPPRPTSETPPDPELTASAMALPEPTAPAEAARDDAPAEPVGEAMGEAAPVKVEAAPGGAVAASPPRSPHPGASTARPVEEPIALFLPEPIDQKLEFGHLALGVTAVAVETNYLAIQRKIEEHGVEEADQVAPFFTDVSSSYLQAANNLEKLARLEPHDDDLDTRARKLAKLMRNLSELAEKSYTYRLATEEGHASEELIALDAQWDALMAQFTPAHHDFLITLFSRTHDLIKSRYAQTDAHTSPLSHAFHGALMELLDAMRLAEASNDPSNALKSLNKLSSHIKTFQSHDPLALPDPWTAKAKNLLSSVTNGVKIMPAKFDDITKAHQKATTLEHGAHARQTEALAWSYLYMAYNIPMKRYFAREP